MNASILDLTNRLLRRVNEVELNVDNFTSARGIHAVAKDAILDTIQRMNKEFYQWPFDAAQHTQTLVIGQTEYSWPANFRTADRNSFILSKSDPFSINTSKLQYVDRDAWYDYARDYDMDQPIVGRGVPNVVFETHGLGFGVSPSPDKEYEIVFRYFKHPIVPNEPLETSNIPENYEYIILDGAMFHMKVFKEDAEGAQLFDQKFKEGIKIMKSIYGRRFESIRDHRVNQGRGRGYFNG